MQLFRAWSVLDHYKGQNEVTFNWFVVGRKKPIAPYEELIENYDDNNAEAWCDNLFVNEFFTNEEIKELKEYLLLSHQMEVQVEEVSLPVRSGGLSYGLLLINGAIGFYSLADEEGYNLSVSVLGHYEVEEQDFSNLLTSKDLQNGLDFLKLVLNNLNLKSESSFPSLT
ncbi:hypothetical protein [Desulforamulus reducens]|nr:hypothetical protein [Desulforamulus reducens]